MTWNLQSYPTTVLNERMRYCYRSVGVRILQPSVIYVPALWVFIMYRSVKSPSRPSRQYGSTREYTLENGLLRRLPSTSFTRWAVFRRNKYIVRPNVNKISDCVDYVEPNGLLFSDLHDHVENDDYCGNGWKISHLSETAVEYCWKKKHLCTSKGSAAKVFWWGVFFWSK